MTNSIKWYEKHISYYWQKIIDFYHGIIPGIKNVITWFPIIWKDRQWDHAFLYVVLQKKLDLMYHFWSVKKPKYVKERGWHLTERDRKNIKEILICKELVKRLMEDEYSFKNPDMWDLHEKKFGSIIKRLYNNDIGMFCSPIKTKEEIKDIHKMMNYELAMKKQDKELLYKILNKKLEYWWD